MEFIYKKEGRNKREKDKAERGRKCYTLTFGTKKVEERKNFT